MKSRLSILLTVNLLTTVALASGATAPRASSEPIQAIIYLDNPNGLDPAFYELPKQIPAKKPRVSTYGPSVNSQIQVENSTDEVAPAASERPDSSPGSPPLETDDAGTPGRHGYELNFVTDCNVTSTGRACEAGIDAAFGIGEHIELQMSKAVTNEKVAGEPSRKGVNAGDFGVKVRFIDKNGWQIATYPSFKLNDATKFRNADGSYQETDGSSVYLPLIVSRDIGHKLTVVANVGYRANLQTSEKDSLFTSASVSRSFSDTSRGMAELTSEKFRYSRLTEVRIGWVKVLFPKSRSRYQTSLFTSLGHSIGKTDDRLGHTTLLFGITVTRKPD